MEVKKRKRGKNNSVDQIQLSMRSMTSLVKSSQYKKLRCINITVSDR